MRKLPTTLLRYFCFWWLQQLLVETIYIFQHMVLSMAFFASVSVFLLRTLTIIGVHKNQGVRGRAGVAGPHFVPRGAQRQGTSKKLLLLHLLCVYVHSIHSAECQAPCDQCHGLQQNNI
jgi:hypothetical protein